MSMPSSESDRLREEGNAMLKSAFPPNLPLAPTLEHSRINKAIYKYDQAYKASTTCRHGASACKNSAAALVKLAHNCVPRLASFPKEHADSVVGLYILAFQRQVLAARLGIKTHEKHEAEPIPNAWLQHLVERMMDVLDKVDGLNDLDAKVRFLTVASHENMVNEPFLGWHIMLNKMLAELLIRRCVQALNEGKWGKALSLAADAERPLRTALACVGDTEWGEPERFIAMQQDLFVAECHARSVQARDSGDVDWETVMWDHENLEMEMVWIVVDKYRQSILLTLGKDVENEAIGHARLGRVFLRALKNPQIAKEHFQTAIRLAIALRPRMMDGHDWHVECVDGLEEIQKLIDKEEATMRNYDRAPLLEKLAPQLTVLNEKAQESYQTLLRHVYSVHKPRPRDGVHSDVEEIVKLDCKKCLLKALKDYHPDKQVADEGTEWLVLCEEITKCLNAKYEMFKSLD